MVIMLSLFKKLLDRNKPIKTLGGASRDTEIPVDNGTVSGDMSFRPMMPYPSGGAPVNPSEYQGSVSGDMVARPLMPTQSGSTPMAVSPFMDDRSKSAKQNYIEKEMRRRMDKDFSKTKNEDGTVTYGKDYDKDHNWWDVVKGIGIGFTKGGLGGAIGGGIGAAFDPNYDEKWGNQMQLQGLQKQYAGEMGVRKMEDEEKDRALDRDYRQKQIDYLAIKPEQQQQEIDRKIAKDKADLDLKVKTLNWKREDRDRYFELEEMKQQARQANDDKKFELAVRKQAEIERANGAKEAVNERKVAVAERKAAIAVEKVSTNKTPTGKPKKSMSPQQMQGWTKFAQGIDEKFNSGEIDEATYNNLIRAMEVRIAQQ